MNNIIVSKNTGKEFTVEEKNGRFFLDGHELDIYFSDTFYIISLLENQKNTFKVKGNIEDSIFTHHSRFSAYGKKIIGVPVNDRYTDYSDEKAFKEIRVDNNI